MYYNGITMVLQWYYNGITMYYNGITMVSHTTYNKGKSPRLQYNKHYNDNWNMQYNELYNETLQWNWTLQ